MADEYEVIKSGILAYQSFETPASPSSGTKGHVGIYWELRKYESCFKFYWAPQCWHSAQGSMRIYIWKPSSTSDTYFRFFEKDSEDLLYDAPLSATRSSSIRSKTNNTVKNTWRDIEVSSTSDDIVCGEFEISPGWHTFCLETQNLKLGCAAASNTYYFTESLTLHSEFTLNASEDPDYIVKSSGMLYDRGPEEDHTGILNIGDVGVYWELRTYDNEDRLFWQMKGWYGQVVSSLVNITLNGSSQANFRFYEVGGEDLYAPTLRTVSYASSGPRFGDNNPKDTWYDLYQGSYNEGTWATRGEYVLPAGEHTFALESVPLRFYYSSSVMYTKSAYVNSDSAPTFSVMSTTGQSSNNNVKIIYGSNIILNDENNTDLSVYYNGQLISNTLGVIKCKNKFMTEDLIFGNYIIKCKNKFMEHDLIITN